MSKQIEALKLAIEVFDGNWHDEIVDTDWADKANNALTVMREALEKEALHKLAAESLNEGLRLDDWDKIGCVNHDCDKCKALAEQPAQEPAQEPVAIHQFRKRGCSDWYDGVPDHHDGQGPYEVRTLYTTPQAQPRAEGTLAREWVDLTVTEQNELCRELAASRHQVRAIGAKLKEKNT